ncbi:hypothetical protein M9H77_23595 [Catharanthus roseus]|uniref:Uncharacterized protein n=1 Tax=Catharanthus roseus TaxID=4058 RepID=A0ACC0ATC8_CATRO|nr:hypothetical protein M9H77_23595 [Catharanthus roseus]
MVSALPQSFPANSYSKDTSRLDQTDSPATHHPEVSSLTSGAAVSPTLKQAQPAGLPTCTPDSSPCSWPCKNHPNLIRILWANRRKGSAHSFLFSLDDTFTKSKRQVIYNKGQYPSSWCGEWKNGTRLKLNLVTERVVPKRVIARALKLIFWNERLISKIKRRFSSNMELDNDHKSIIMQRNIEPIEIKSSSSALVGRSKPAF